MDKQIDLSKVKSLEEDLSLYSSLTNKEVEILYNVDCREEALSFIRDWWSMMSNE